MSNPLHIAHALEDLLADLCLARKHEQLGRLALLAYCDVKRWARQAGKGDIADLALHIFSKNPSRSKADFLLEIDHLIQSLQIHEIAVHYNSARFPGSTHHTLRSAVHH